jgi:hypothetical protein
LGNTLSGGFVPGGLIERMNPSNPVLLYTIGFQVTTASQNLLKGCATKPDMFYQSRLAAACTLFTPRTRSSA